jgi:hypothetical protein
MNVPGEYYGLVVMAFATFTAASMNLFILILDIANVF